MSQLLDENLLSLHHETPDDFTHALQRTRWVERMAGGPTRVLFIGPYSAQHDSYELMQRFDFDARVITVTDHYTPETFGVHGHYWPDLEIPAEQALTALRAALREPWDSILLGAKPPWHHYPSDLQDALLDRLLAGTTLLFAESESGRLLAALAERGAPCLPLEPAAAARLYRDTPAQGQAWRCGRGLLLAALAPEDHRHQHLLSDSPRRSEFEASCAQAGWLLAGSRPGHDALPALEEVSVLASEITLAIGHHDDPLTINLLVRRSRDYHLMARASWIAAPQEPVRAALGSLPDGDYRLEVVIEKGTGEACDWISHAFQIGGGDQSRTIDVTPAVASPGQVVTVRFHGQPEDRGARAAWRWLDVWGRLLAEGQVELSGQAVPLIAPDHALGVLTRLEWTIFHTAASPVWQGEAEICLRGSALQEDFPMLYWQSELGDSWRQRVRSAWLRDHALADALANTPVHEVAARSAALEGLRTVPYATWFHRILLDEHLFQDGWLEATEARARTAATAHRDYGALAYTLGDEIYVSAFEPQGRFADQPVIWQRFQAYLQQRYGGDLAALNAQWQSAYPTWEAIRFERESELYAGAENPSAWVNFRQFISHSFTEALQRMREAIRQIDPQAVVGWDGLEHYSSYDGIDLWAICQGMDLIQMYQTKLHSQRHPTKIFNGEAVRSFVRQPKFSGMWLNSVDRHHGGQMMPWYVLFKGWKSVWWWHGAVPHPVNSAFTWDLKPTAIVASICASVKEIRRGAAALLTRSEPVFSPIAIFYSEANWHASTIESGTGNHINNLGVKQDLWEMQPLVGREAPADQEQLAMWGSTRASGHYVASSRSMHLMLRDLGHQPQTLASAELNPATLAAHGIRVLFLPYMSSLSEDEARTIEAFVEAGGTVIADYRTGLRDEHGRLRSRGVLDELFGFERSAVQTCATATEVTFDVLHQAGGRLPAHFHDPIVLTEARAMGVHTNGTPALLVRSRGRGKAIYLNMDLSDYHLWRETGNEEKAKRVLGLLCQELGQVAPPVTLQDERRRPVAAMETLTFQGHRSRFVAIHPDPSVDRPLREQVTVTLAEPGHVYDVRRQQYLGCAQAIPMSLHREQPVLLAILPQALGTLQVHGPERLSAGERCELKVWITGLDETTAPGWACRLEVFGPHDQPVPWHTRTLHFTEAEGRFTLPLARNEPAGRWRLRFTEAFTGQCVEWAIDIRK